MSTSCISVKGQDLWLNDTDLSVLLGLVANDPKISSGSSWALSLRQNWPNVRASFAPGCISTGLEEISENDAELSEIARDLKSILQAVKGDQDLLSSARLNYMGIPGVVFCENYPLDSIEKAITGIIQLIAPRA